MTTQTSNFAYEPVVWEAVSDEGYRAGETTDPTKSMWAQCINIRFRTASSPHLWQVCDGKLFRPLGEKEFLEIGDEWAHLAEDDWLPIPQNYWGAIVNPMRGMRYRRMFSTQPSNPPQGAEVTDTQLLDLLERIDIQKYIFGNWIKGGGTLRSQLLSVIQQPRQSHE